MFLAENRGLLLAARGSSHNHQDWVGGYLDHIVDGSNIAIRLYECLSGLRALPFELSSALVVFFVHDTEKPWKYALQTSVRSLYELETKEQRREFRLAKIAEYGIALSAEESRALEYVEGEGKAYSPQFRAMNELGAFCHMVDVASARLWHAYPKAAGRDEWRGADRSVHTG